MTQQTFNAQPQWLTRFIEMYQVLDNSNLALLEQVYHRQVVFEDPMHKVTGLSALESYFANLYQNLSYCHFTIEKVIASEQQAALYWLMSFAHPKLNGGQKIEVKGNSLLQCQEDKVVYHRDYFDAGTMLYEQIPLLGRVIRYVKSRLAA